MPFYPEGMKGKRPAILNVIGHTGIAFRGEGYQVLIYNLVKKGFIVFAIDPVGQGERLQYFDPEKKASLIGGPTSEHSYFGNQCFLIGVSPGLFHLGWHTGYRLSFDPQGGRPTEDMG